MKTITTFLALSLAFVLSACGESSQQTAGTDAAAAAQIATPPTAKGKTGKAENVDFTITSVDQPSQVGMAGMGPKAEAGETFVVVSYTLKNTGTGALPLMERPSLSLIDPSGTSYSPDDSATLMAAGMMDDPSGMASDLNPNVSAKSKAAWKVDKAAFDRATWTLAVAADPTLTFALK